MHRTFLFMLIVDGWHVHCTTRSPCLKTPSPYERKYLWFFFKILYFVQYPIVIQYEERKNFQISKIFVPPNSHSDLLNPSGIKPINVLQWKEICITDSKRTVVFIVIKMLWRIYWLYSMQLAIHYRKKRK